jgi:DNA-directed RNA polymerase sigma subunit (sigma70/sigma32)
MNYSERVSSLDINIGKENNNSLVNFVSEKRQPEPDEAINADDDIPEFDDSDDDNDSFDDMGDSVDD